MVEVIKVKKPETVEIMDDDDDDDDDEVIDEEQLAEYREMVEQLGSFPDKVKINSLSMVAEDHADSQASARAIYNTIRDQLLKSSAVANMLPLVYVLDSILKNAKGQYVPIMGQDAANWIPVVYRKLDNAQKQKLQKVWRTWNEFSIFAPDNWKAMGTCFDSRMSDKAIGSSSAKVAGISRTRDGTLLIPALLRSKMQEILDELQTDIHDELEKVSLERLADINPDLLANIKQTAQDSMSNGGGMINSESNLQQDANSSTLSIPKFMTEVRLPSAVESASAWSNFEWDAVTDTNDALEGIATRVQLNSSSEQLYTQTEAINMTHLLAVASATAHILRSSLSDYQAEMSSNGTPGNTNGGGNAKSTATGGSQKNNAHSARTAVVNSSKFTNEGIKEKNEGAVGMLYEIGLPFVSSSDGRRFATQLQLSKHLDAMFRRNQLEKSMGMTEERGWYISTSIWTGDEAVTENETNNANVSKSESGADNDPAKSLVIADEAREKCSICGLRFQMVFDNDDGVYKYKNCREIEVLDDDDISMTDTQLVLIHATCWHGLGSPEILTSDQVIT